MDPVHLTPAHRLLLRAALLPGDAAVAAYERWKALTPFDDVDAQSYRLLPCLFRNLSQAGIEDDLTPRLRGIYRRTWYANQLALPVIAETVTALHEAGIATRVLGGALANLHYRRHPGLCDLHALDLLPYPGQFQAAFSLLKRLGWTPLEGRYGVWALAGSAPAYLFLHEQIVHGLAPAASAAAHAHVWDAAQTYDVNGQTVWLLSPDEQLLFIANYNLRGGSPHPLRWLSDAAFLLTSDTLLDWDDLLAQARLRHAGAALAALFRSLIPILSPDGSRLPRLPSDFLSALDASVQEAASAPPAWDNRAQIAGLPVWQRLQLARRQLWRSYRRYCTVTFMSPSLPGFARYLTAHWQLSSPWQLPRAALQRLVRPSAAPPPD